MEIITEWLNYDFCNIKTDVGQYVSIKLQTEIIIMK